MPLLDPDALDAWVAVDREALAHNFRQVRSHVAPGVRVLAVVKADAYGHGAVEASRVFLAAGAGFLGVTRIEEGIELRDAGIEAPVLVFSAALPAQAETIVGRRLSATVCTLEAAQALSAAAPAGGAARVHVKVDTGMGRIGIRPEELPGFLQALAELPGVEVEGIYTHFATATGSDTAFAARQLDRFLQAVSTAQADAGKPLLHAANSAALLRLPQAHLDMVRPGTILYGQYPSAHVPRKLELRETWQLKARVTFIKQIRKGESIGYGRDFIAPRPMMVATIPLGTADGLTATPVRPTRSLSELAGAARDFLRRGNMGVRIGGRHAPFVGRVSMQMCCVDVSHLPDVRIGDEVVLPARRTMTSARIPRIYHGDSAPAGR